MTADLSPVDATQREIIAALHVAPLFDAAAELARRTDFLADYLRSTGLKALVLGISGGVDSLTAGCLAQRAVEKLRAEGRDATFIAMRLPYGVQRDEAEAQAGLAVIRPDRLLTVDIRPAADAMLAALRAGDLVFRDAAHEDFVLGNIKARQRMIAQFAVAGAQDGLVIGTDHAAEALMGFFTKFGDGAADVTPLTGLNKRRVRALAALLGAPDALVYKVPTADLESLVPGKPDEDAFGVSYEQIDDFLEGKPVSAAARAVILSTHRKSAHKRALPVEPPTP
ncbi:ammonia-dependent NAD(+) synthetase [Variovorax sp. EBFNA2]|uniref:ammonia-dependent NAD(+) synthetase n=1 Tax=Variovorax sp. EBFNA2 TaxID=3342097 RepID=UPI0029C04BB9|nr:ammonia-dependent NAD(+) synthetase [Variovorax boronicumulans]WPG38353.1 ammonia-dependent NAD(+) synthetase [Variovorax boronicumulans]